MRDLWMSIVEGIVRLKDGCKKKWGDRMKEGDGNCYTEFQTEVANVLENIKWGYERNLRTRFVQNKK